MKIWDEAKVEGSPVKKAWEWPNIDSHRGVALQAAGLRPRRQSHPRSRRRCFRMVADVEEDITRTTEYWRVGTRIVGQDVLTPEIKYDDE